MDFQWLKNSSVQSFWHRSFKKKERYTLNINSIFFILFFSLAKEVTAHWNFERERPLLPSSSFTKCSSLYVHKVDPHINMQVLCPFAILSLAILLTCPHYHFLTELFPVLGWSPCLTCNPRTLAFGSQSTFSRSGKQRLFLNGK